MNSLKENRNRVNWEIRAFQVRLIGPNNEQLGVVPIEQARRVAQDNELDLVEVVSNANPIICRVMDYSKYKFEQKVKQKEASKKHRDTMVNLKELRLRPNIADHDVEIKVAHARKFLLDGDKVQFNLKISGQREMKFRDKAFVVVSKIIDSLKDCSIVEKLPKLEGNRIICILLPIKK